MALDKANVSLDRNSPYTPYKSWGKKLKLSFRFLICKIVINTYPAEPLEGLSRTMNMKA